MTDERNQYTDATREQVEQQLVHQWRELARHSAGPVSPLQVRVIETLEASGFTDLARKLRAELDEQVDVLTTLYTLTEGYAEVAAA